MSEPKKKKNQPPVESPLDDLPPLEAMLAAAQGRAAPEDMAGDTLIPPPPLKDTDEARGIIRARRLEKFSRSTSAISELSGFLELGSGGFDSFIPSLMKYAHDAEIAILYLEQRISHISGKYLHDYKVNHQQRLDAVLEAFDLSPRETAQLQQLSEQEFPHLRPVEAMEQLTHSFGVLLGVLESKIPSYDREGQSALSSWRGALGDIMERTAEVRRLTILQGHYEEFWHLTATAHEKFEGLHQNYLSAIHALRRFEEAARDVTILSVGNDNAWKALETAFSAANAYSHPRKLPTTELSDLSSNIAGKAMGLRKKRLLLTGSPNYNGLPQDSEKYITEFKRLNHGLEPNDFPLSLTSKAPTKAYGAHPKDHTVTITTATGKSFTAIYEDRIHAPRYSYGTPTSDLKRKPNYHNRETNALFDMLEGKEGKMRLVRGQGGILENVKPTLPEEQMPKNPEVLLETVPRVRLPGGIALGETTRATDETFIGRTQEGEVLGGIADHHAERVAARLGATVAGASWLAAIEETRAQEAEVKQKRGGRH